MLDPKPSKSELKRQDQALKRLGEELIALRPSRLDELPLEQTLRDAVLEAQGMRAHGALRRQRQRIGKLLRQTDAAAIRAGLEALNSDSVADKRRFRLAEEWRDRLVAEGFDALDVCAAETGADINRLRELLRTLARPLPERTLKTARRELFRTVHDALSR